MTPGDGFLSSRHEMMGGAAALLLVDERPLYRYYASERCR
jgi:hypothetical protein